MQPPCDSPGCPIKRALFILEDYKDDAYNRQCVEQGGEQQVMYAAMTQHTREGWERWGFLHCYEVKNVCHNCLCGHVETFTRGAHGANLVNQLRDTSGECLFFYLLYREQGAPGRFAFCGGKTIEECVQKVRKKK